MPDFPHLGWPVVSSNASSSVATGMERDLRREGHQHGARQCVPCPSCSHPCCVSKTAGQTSHQFAPSAVQIHSLPNTFKWYLMPKSKVQKWSIWDWLKWAGVRGIHAASMPTAETQIPPTSFPGHCLETTGLNRLQ